MGAVNNCNQIKVQRNLKEAFEDGKMREDEARCSEHPLGKWPRHCRICGKEFYANDDWVYKIRRGPKEARWFCRYNCMQAYKKEEERKKEERKRDRALGKKRSTWEGP